MGKIILSLALAFAFTICIWYIVLTDNQKQAKYILKTFEGHIALYRNGKIEEIYDAVTVGELPEEDINLLNNGIKLKNKEEALQYIEDYDG